MSSDLPRRSPTNRHSDRRRNRASKRWAQPEAWLRLISAHPGFYTLDRLAWYASDRGDAIKAARLWWELEPTPAIGQDLREVERFTSSLHPRLGRNDPCWCGSGRKYKQCHLGSTELPPLSDRVGWLCRKAVAFLERRGAMARADVLDIAYARAVARGVIIVGAVAMQRRDS